MRCICMFCVVADVDVFFFFKQKTAYEMRISDWSSDVCSSDLFVNVDGELVGDDLHLVDETDVNRAVNVLKQLSQFSRAGGADRHELVNDLAVERHADVKAGGCATAHDFGDRAGGEVGIARIRALRRGDKIDFLTEGERFGAGEGRG